MVINFTPIDKRLCIIKIKGRFFNYYLIIINAPTNDSEKAAKDQFYKQLKRAYVACLSHDMKLVMGDQPTIGKHSLHEITNENGLRLVDFATLRQIAIKRT
jgi:hypothetical protein